MMGLVPPPSDGLSWSFPGHEAVLRTSKGADEGSVGQAPCIAYTLKAMRVIPPEQTPASIRRPGKPLQPWFRAMAHSNLDGECRFAPLTPVRGV